MARRQLQVPCAVCKVIVPTSKLSRVVVERKTVPLCRAHATVVASRMPRTFEELRALFREEAAEPGAPARRSVIPRRGAEDRRAFPPRPEGRRIGAGRRAADDEAA